MNFKTRRQPQPPPSLCQAVVVAAQILIMFFWGIPEVIRTDCGFVVTGREARCVLLYRMV